MIYDYPQTKFSNAIFAGVFAGYFATLANLGFDFIFRAETGFPLSQIINVSTIIFATLIVVSAGGLMYYFLKQAGKAGSVLYMVTFVALTIFSILLISHVNRDPDMRITVEFRELVTGIIVVTGVATTIFVPYLDKNAKKFF
ncbi:MAG: hypothetical protein KGO81_06360 [Bacteroidota bacterium]|nr:hypothetical protein [Bacteroidota bacterium]